MTTQHYTLHVADSAGALPRVVGLCQRRGCEIVALSYAHGDRHRPGRVDLAVRGDDRHLRPLRERLSALVDVHRVD